MKTYSNISILLLSLVSLLAVSCQKEEKGNEVNMPEGFGALSVRTLDLDDAMQAIQTKAFGMDVNTFKVVLEKQSDDENATEPEEIIVYETYAEMKKEDFITLPVGFYTVKAYSREKMEGGAFTPYFCGEQTNVEIFDKKVTNIKLEATFQSVGVDINLSRSFQQLFMDNYQIEVQNGKGKSVMYTKDTDGKVIYFDDVEGGLTLRYTIQAVGTDEPYPLRVKDLLNKGANPKINQYYMVEFQGDQTKTSVAF